MYDDILVPTDGSPRAEQAIEHAVAVGDRFDAVIHVLHVLQRPDADELEDMDDVIDRLETAGEQAVEDAVAATERPADELDTAVRRGMPETEIIEYATENDIDLLVMATAGRTGDSREMLGSVTEAVVRNSPVPVLSVNSADHSGET